MSEKEQKIKLYELLNSENYGEIVKEKKFDWGNTIDYQNRYSFIYEPIRDQRNYSDFIKTKYIGFDFVLEDKKIIIEYDERQHFTNLRKIALESYPDDIRLYYDKALWIERCNLINAKDNEPVYRDEQRALLDSIRDISSYRNGYKLIRTYYKEYDFNNEADCRRFIDRINSLIDE